MAMQPSTRANVVLSLVDKMSPALRRVSAKLDRMAVRARRAGMAMGAAAIALGTGLYQASKSAVELDTNMRQVQARMGSIDARGLSELREEAMRLGSSTRYTIGQVSALMATLAKAGVAKDGIMGMSAGMLDFATATGVTASEAAEIALRGVKQFGMEQTAENVSRVTDAMAYAVNNAQMSITDLGETMQYAGGLASAYGQTLEDTLAGVAMMGDVGITGSMAGTTYNAMFRELAEGNDVLDKYKINVQALDGSMRSLPSLFAELGEKMKGLSDLDKIREMKEIFQRLGVKGAIIGVREVDAITKLASKMYEIKGYTKTLAAIVDGGIEGTLWRMVSALDGFGVRLAETILPIVNEVAKVFTRWVNIVSPMLEKFEWLGVTVLGVFTALAGGAVALLTFAGVSTVLATAFSTVASIFTGALTVIGGLLTGLGAVVSLPMWVVVAGIAGAVVQVGLLAKAWDVAKAAFGAFFSKINIGAGGIVAALELGEFEVAWQLTMDTMQLAALASIEQMNSAWKEHFEYIASGGTTILSGIKDFFGLGQYAIGYINSAINETFTGQDGVVEAFDEDFTRSFKARRAEEDAFKAWVAGAQTVSERESRLQKRVTFAKEYLRRLKEIRAKEKELDKSGTRAEKQAKPYDNSKEQEEAEKLRKKAQKELEKARKLEEKKWKKIKFTSEETMGAVGASSVAAASAKLSRDTLSVAKDQLSVLKRIDGKMNTQTGQIIWDN